MNTKNVDLDVDPSEDEVAEYYARRAFNADDLGDALDAAFADSEQWREGLDPQLADEVLSHLEEVLARGLSGPLPVAPPRRKSPPKARVGKPCTKRATRKQRAPKKFGKRK